jgi:DnaJ-class molecular chaperone
MDLPISIPDAVLGGKIEAPTPDGNVMLNVPKGSQQRPHASLKGRGMPDAKGKRGDLLARLVVTLPETVDEDLEKFAQAWRDQKPYTPKRPWTNCWRA